MSLTNVGEGTNFRVEFVRYVNGIDEVTDLRIVGRDGKVKHIVRRYTDAEMRGYYERASQVVEAFTCGGHYSGLSSVEQVIELHIAWAWPTN